MSAPPAACGAPLLEVRGLVRRFGGLPAVDDLDLDVEAGEVLAVIGPNGAGKSTLLHLLSGLLTPTSVRGMTFAGHDIVGRRPHAIRRLGLATVLQRPQVFPRSSVRDNVALGAMFGGVDRVRPADALARAEEVLDLVAPELHRADRDGDVDRLTLHQRRLVELARALAGGPRLLLLDEVMAGLNPTELVRFIEVVRGVRDARGLTVVVVEHVMEAVTALADRVVVMDLGRQLAQGRPAEVMRDRTVVEAYLGSAPDHHAQG